jgi:hypothetical protein
MAKNKRSSSTRRFTVTSNTNDRTVTIRRKATGTALTLKGYGALKGEYIVNKGIDLSKPIAAQAAKNRKTAASAIKVARKQAG